MLRAKMSLGLFLTAWMLIPLAAEGQEPPEKMTYYYVAHCKVGRVTTPQCFTGSSQQAVESAASSWCASQGGTIVDAYYTYPEDPECGVPMAYSQLRPWDVYFSICCCDGKRIKAKGMGATYCEAYRRAKSLACSLAASHEGARYGWVSRVVRPCPCVKCVRCR